MPKKKKNYKRRKNNFNRRSGSGMGKLVPLPSKWRFSTRYMENNLLIDPTQGTNSEHIFRLNSLYDPDYATGGHQPLGFDQLAPLYTYYTVIGCRARVTMTNTDDHHPCNLYVFPSINAGNLSSDDQLKVMTERGLARWCQLAPAGTGGSTKTLTLNWSAKEFFGKRPFEHQDYTALMNNNPLAQAYLHVAAQPLNASPLQDPYAIVGSIVLEYIAILTEPKPMPMS
jgi:hypothetical protein